MQKKFQIFVSSTYQDLIEERRAVIEAILDLGHIPIGMEAFQASNEEQWSYIRKRIDEADYYVVIVAERYGSTNDQGVSYTEMEYDYARKKGVPVAAFLLHEDADQQWGKICKGIFLTHRGILMGAFRKAALQVSTLFTANLTPGPPPFAGMSSTPAASGGVNQTDH